MNVPGGYLDNCISPTGVVRAQIEPIELDALDELNRREAAGEVELYTSDVVKEEVDKTPHPGTLERLNALRDLYERLPTVDEEWRMSRPIRSSRSGPTAGRS